MARHRYRTAALVGRWWTTAEEAWRDALRAGLARRDEARDIIHWEVPGEIEIEGGNAASR